MSEIDTSKKYVYELADSIELVWPVQAHTAKLLRALVDDLDHHIECCDGYARQLEIAYKQIEALEKHDDE